MFLVGAVNKVYTAPWPHCPNRNVFNDRRNSLYDKSMSFGCDGRLFHSPGPAAENALSPKVLCVRVTTHVWLWNAAAVHEHRRQDGSRRPGTMAKCQKTTGGRTWPSWNGRAGALIASVADGAPAIHGLSVEYRHQTRTAAFWTDCSRFISPSEVPKNSELQYSRRQETNALTNCQTKSVGHKI